MPTNKTNFILDTDKRLHSSGIWENFMTLEQNNGFEFGIISDYLRF